MDRIAFLVIVHKDISNLIFFSRLNLDMNFYIHLDKKIDIEGFLLKLPPLPPNIYFIKNRVSINWAGFSMIQATLNLLNEARCNSENEYFHLISGEDVILKKGDNLKWTDHSIYIEKYETLDNRYRMRLNFFYADTIFQRKIVFKIITQIFKRLDVFFITSKKYYCGSQWFSIKRSELELILHSITDADFNFFKKKLCPDEHFFQYLIKKNNLISKISSEGNKRFIVFDNNFQRGSSPIFLNKEQLNQAKKHGYWFARKVEQGIMKEFYEQKFEV